MARNRNSAARSGNFTKSSNLSAMLDKPNIWSDWLADIHFPDPRIEPADEYLLRHFYQDLTTRCRRALPLNEFVEPERNWQDPFDDPSVDDYLSRMVAFERISIRNLGRLFSAKENITDLSQDAWARYRDGSDWDRLLDLADVPRFDWRRQVAFLLREVPVLFKRLDLAIMEMEAQTETAVLDQHRDKGKPVSAIGFGDWFGQWREHFRHWHDPLRTALIDLCVGQPTGNVTGNRKCFAWQSSRAMQVHFKT